MPKRVENPRYNVLSFRVSVEELAEIESVVSGDKTDFLRASALFCAKLRKAPVKITPDLPGF